MFNHWCRFDRMVSYHLLKKNKTGFLWTLYSMSWRHGHQSNRYATATCYRTSTAAAIHSSTVSCRGISGEDLKPLFASVPRDASHTFVIARAVVTAIRGTRDCRFTRITRPSWSLALTTCVFEVPTTCSVAYSYSASLLLLSFRGTLVGSEKTTKIFHSNSIGARQEC